MAASDGPDFALKSASCGLLRPILRGARMPTVSVLMPVGAVADGQSPRMAWIAVTRYFKPQVVIPMHYGALPGSSTEADLRAVFGKDPRVVFMKPGETKKF